VKDQSLRYLQTCRQRPTTEKPTMVLFHQVIFKSRLNIYCVDKIGSEMLNGHSLKVVDNTGLKELLNHLAQLNYQTILII